MKVYLIRYQIYYRILLNGLLWDLAFSSLVVSINRFISSVL